MQRDHTRAQMGAVSGRDLAVDRDTNDLVVIELIRGRTGDRPVIQPRSLDANGRLRTRRPHPIDPTDPQSLSTHSCLIRLRRTEWSGPA